MSENEEVEGGASTLAAEPIDKEEVLNLGISLNKVRNDPEKSLNILRLLKRKAITAELL